MNPIIIEFLDGVIRYHEHSNQWSYEIGESVVGHRASLSDAKALATNHGKDKSKFERHVVLHRDGPYGDLEAVDLTSYSRDADYKGRRQAWISKKDKSRKLASEEELFEYTSENNGIVVQVAELEAQKDRLNERIKAFEAKLTPYTFRKQPVKK